MRLAIAIAAVILVSGCFGSGKEVPDSGSGAPPPSSSESVVSLLDCGQSAVLFRAEEGASREEVPDQYAFAGQGLVSTVLLVMDCEGATLGNVSSLGRVRLAFVYVFLDETSAVGNPVYLLEAFTDSEPLESFMQSLGMPAQLAAVLLQVDGDGGTISIEGPVSYQVAVAGLLDENGNIQDGAFAFHHDQNGTPSIMVLDQSFTISSRLVASAIISASGGVLGRIVPAGAQPALADKSLIRATLRSG